MHDASGAWIGWGLGDDSPTVQKLKELLKAKFSYASALDDSTLFDGALEDVVKEVQSRYGLQATGVIDYDLQVKMGFIKPAPPAPVVKPIVFTVEGHTSPWNVGPVASTGQQMETEGLARWQPVGYNNNPIPFDNASGTTELARLLGLGVLDDGNPFPLGTPWVLCGYSQGMIVVTDFIENFLQPGQVHAPRAKDLLGVLAYGNPCRSTGSVAPWSEAQAGPAANHGIDPKVRLDENKISLPVPLMDVYRKGDLFADCEPTEEGDIKGAIYQAVARSDLFSNPYSIVGQIMQMFSLDPTPGAANHGLVDVDPSYLMAIIQAIISGIQFLGDNPNPHYAPYDTSGGINWVRGLLQSV